MAARLRAAGFPAADVQVLAPQPRKGNLVARLRGTGQRRPLLLLAHLDVVEARREDWSTDPFTLLEKDGYFYGRGTGDDKAMAAIWIATLIRLKQEGYRPDRDIIVALTADEETGPANGVHWLLENHRGLIDAELALNEGGRGQIKDGRYLANGIQASEKVYESFRLEVTNAGGHSSLPRKDNAIYRLAAGLGRLAAFDFPVRLSEVTRAYFERMASIAPGPEADDMKAVLRTPPDARQPRWRRRRAGSPLELAVPQRAHAHDLRGHAPGGRTRGERAAADGARDRELPDPARDAGGRGPGHPGRGGRRRRHRDHVRWPRPSPARPRPCSPTSWARWKR